MKHVLLFVFGMLTFTGSVFSQTGPGGVGTNDGSSTLKFWIRTDNGVSVTGTSIDAITNSAGESDLDISETGSQRPTLVAGAVNGYDEISFSGLNRLRTGLTLTTSNFVNNQASSFTVCRADLNSQTSCVYTTDPLVGSTRFSNHIPWNSTVYFDVGTCCGTTARLQVGGLAGLSGYSVWSYDAESSSGKQLYRNGALLQSRTGTSTYSSHASHRFNVGGNTSGTNGYQGDVTEVIIYTTKVNSAQRIIIENYLAAKYGITTASNDVFDEDDAIAGDYDHDVAGIGRVDASNLHNDSQGTGRVRVSNPSNLDNDEFFMWGHDGGEYEATNFMDVPGSVLARMDRIWRASESSSAGASVDVGSLDISWDLNGLGMVVASDLRLIIDSDNDGLFSDETPISGATDDGGGIYTFSGVSGISDNRRFTLGTINIWTTPLPVEIVYFEAGLRADKKVAIEWKTLSERNNDFFIVERSVNGLDWKQLAKVEGQGTSSVSHDYLEIDHEPFTGINYYRLIQVDFDGTRTDHGTRSVFVASEPELLVFPNPANGYVVLEGLSNSSERPEIYDITGKNCTAMVQMELLGEYVLIHLNELADGVYVIKTSEGLRRFCKQSH